MAVLLGIAFVAGLITAISPCVLPVMPVLFAGSVAGGNRRRPFAIVAGIVASFTVFTLSGSALLSALGLPQDFLRNFAIAMLFVLAATLIVPQLGLILERPLVFLSRRRTGGDHNAFLLGSSLGLVFVPCAGPVLAAVTAISASGHIGFRSVLVTLAYALGAGLPMLALALAGQRALQAAKVVRTHAFATRRIAGVVLAATALVIALGVDQRFTTALPGYTSALQDRIERSSVARKELRKLTASGEARAATERARAPEFRGIVEWLNNPGGKPLTLAALRGKVVLVDFWTYSCINCIRTLPHLKAWDAAYRRYGLVIVGVHTPEFAFERVPGNVRSAVAKFGIRYPVALDNGYRTWNAYQNEYWPAEYLIDRAGVIRHTHFGEGEYGETENAIRRLLGEHVQTRAGRVADATPTEVTTPESYLGYARIARYAGSPLVLDRTTRYRFPARLQQDELAYAGEWRVGGQRIEAGEGARLRLRFRAQHVYLVLGGTGEVQVRVDGAPVRTVRVAGTPRLYTLVDEPRLAEGLLELRFTPGIDAYSFTFG
jgi:cytochrome c biogenesis protein CcdA/thiol-disulfide isomerase/thioredoxin